MCQYKVGQTQSLTNLKCVALLSSPWCIDVMDFLFNIPGLWKGLGARILMVGSLTAMQWFIYDSVKVYFRLPRPLPPEMPKSLKRKLQDKQQQAAQ